MNFLEIQTGCTIVKLRQTSDQKIPLEEQAQKYLRQNPFLLLDVGGMEFSSMNIGELVNLRGSFDEIWGGTMHRIALLNLSDTGKDIFSRVGLTDHFPFYDSLEAAIEDFLQ